VTDETDLSLEVNSGIITTRVLLDREIRDHYIFNVETHNNATVSYCQVKIYLKFTLMLLNYT
jgi:hypothetical protein